jgi:hypothetical protein
MRAVADHVRLIYTRAPYGQEPQFFDYAVSIVRTACHYGGTRPWWLCPRCGDRRAVIYGSADSRFGCHGCMRLAFAFFELLGSSTRRGRKLGLRTR